MGWNEVFIESSNSILDVNDLENLPRFYFAHSYHMIADPKFVVGTSHYGSPFPSILCDGSILAMQFHPEKSHLFGMQILKNFSSWSP